MFATENCPKYQVRLSFEFLFIYSRAGGTSVYSGLTPTSNDKSLQFCIFSIKAAPLPRLRTSVDSI
jgi:hypothetical protein